MKLLLDECIDRRLARELPNLVVRTVPQMGWGGTMDCHLGGAVFRLQNYYVKDWAENFMMKFDVDDIDAWHAHAKKVIDEGDFAHARYDTPEMVGGDTKIFHVWDPCGVLLIFIQ